MTSVVSRARLAIPTLLAILSLAGWQGLVTSRQVLAVEQQWISVNSPFWFDLGNWSPAGVPNGPDADVRFDVFQGGASTIEVLGSPFMVRRFLFDEASTFYDILAVPPAELQLAPGGSTVDVMTGQHRISADIVGAEKLTKSGSGQLTLLGNFAYTGDTVIEEGILVLDDGAAADQKLLSPRVILGSQFAGTATLDVTSYSIYELGTGQSLIGMGEILGTVRNQGFVAPEGPSAILNLTGSFQQMASGAMEIELGGLTPGTEHDQVNVSGFLNLAGRLDLRRVDVGAGLFVPGVGDTLDVATGGLVLNTFDSVAISNPVPGLALDVDYHASLVRVTFADPTPANYRATTSGTVNWNDPAIWNLGGDVPSLGSVVELKNESFGPAPATVRVQEHAFAHTVSVTGSLPQGPMNLVVGSNRSLSATHGVLIEALGTLAGLGTVVGDVTNEAGTVSPGDLADPTLAIGELTIDGSYQQAARAALDIDVDARSSDKLTATENIQLAGSLDLNLIGPAPPIGTEYVIFESGGKLTGTFEQVNPNGLGPVILTIGDDAGTITLTKRFNMDLDLEGLVNGDDIDDFVLGLIDPDLYEITHPGNFPHTVGDSDLDADLLLDLDDIPAFEAALLAESGIAVSILSLIGVPEPSGWQLLLVGWMAVGLCYSGRRRGGGFWMVCPRRARSANEGQDPERRASRDL